MAEATPTSLAIGDRSQGYEVSGPSAVAGLDAAYAGKDTGDGDAAVTLLLLAEDEDPSSVLDLARAYRQVDRPALAGLRTVVRFGAGAAGVIGKEDGAPLAGETLATWLGRRAPLGLHETARLFLPVLDALSSLHATGFAHGRISGSQIIVGRDDKARLLGPWLAAGANRWLSPRPRSRLNAWPARPPGQ
jgi:hypothetical protein